MGSDERPAPDSLTHIDRLRADPRRFHVYQALRVLEAHYAANPRLGESRRPQEDGVRLSQAPEMSFARDTVTDYTHGSPDKPARLVSQFFGLFGPNGPLPLHLTNYARDRLRHRHDPTITDFANLFTHRMMGLIYRAWSSSKPATSADRPDRDDFSDAVSALIGRRGDGFAERDAMTDADKRYFAGHLSNATRHAEGLASMVSDMVRAPVRLRSFVGCWLSLEPQDQWRLGGRGGLGVAHQLGERVWSRTAKFELCVGPLDLSRYRALLPGQRGFEQIRAIVRNYVGDAVVWDVRLVLDAKDVPEARLGTDIRLGYSTWIGRREPGRDADQLLLTGQS